MSTAQNVVTIAITQLGVTEATGHNDGVPSERYMGGRSEPWCAWFAAWCYREAGAPLPGDRIGHAGPGGESPIASVAELERRIKLAARFSAAPLGRVPEPGDLVFFADRAGSDHGGGAVQRHVGIVELVTDGDAGATLHTIEGNIANKVCRRVHRLDDPRITGYGAFMAPMV